MNQRYFLLLLFFSPILSAHQTSHNDHKTHEKTKLMIGLIAAGCAIAKPSLLLIPFKALLLPFKLIAALGTIAFFALPVAIAAGVWLAYPHWKKHKKDILAQWDKHKHLISAHVAALTRRGKKILGQVQQGNTTQIAPPQLPTDLSLMANYRA